MRSKIREHRGARVAGGETEPYLPPVPLYMPEAGWSEWLARLARNVNVLGQSTGAVSGGSSVTTSDTAPTSPAPADGDLWFDTVGCQLYTFYIDPSGAPGQWVIANSGIPGPPVTGGGGGGIPEAPLDGVAYGRKSASWTPVLMTTGDIVDGGNF